MSERLGEQGGEGFCLWVFASYSYLFRILWISLSFYSNIAMRDSRSFGKKEKDRSETILALMLYSNQHCLTNLMNGCVIKNLVLVSNLSWKMGGGRVYTCFNTEVNN